MKNRKFHSRRTNSLKRNPFIYILILFTLYGTFLTAILFLAPKPSKAEIYLSNTKDTCGLVGVGVVGSPACNFYSQNTANGCVNPAGNPTSPGVTSQTMTVTLSSLDGKTHKVSVNTSNNFCTSSYFSTSGQFCNCVDNEVNQNQIVTVPVGKSVNVKVSRTSPAGACGSYQLDFSILAVDGNGGCNLGTAGANVGGAVNCETGTTCGSGPPPPPPPPPPTSCTTTPINCSACTAPANTCSNGNGTQTCTLSQPQTCNQVVTTRSCTLNNCSGGATCTNQVCAAPTYTASGTVFIDTNGDGLQNNGEKAYTGGITITGSGGTVTTNAANGTYSVANLTAGAYTVTYTSLPGGYFMTYPLNNPPSFTVTIGGACTVNGAKGASCNAGNVQNLNFGIHPSYTVTGKVFIDTNGDGLQNNGEAAYTGGITITGSGGTVTTNAAAGTYTVANLTAGAYTVTYTSLPGGYFMTYPLNNPASFPITVGGACTVNGAKGASCNAGNVQNLNFGIHTFYSISGNIFKDYNRNGLIDNGEINYAGNFSISISPNVGTITTQLNGNYSVTNLPAGTYTVSYLSLPNGYYLTIPLNGPPPSYTVTVGGSCTTNGAPGAICQ